MMRLRTARRYRHLFKDNYSIAANIVQTIEPNTPIMGSNLISDEKNWKLKKML